MVARLALSSLSSKGTQVDVSRRAWHSGQIRRMTRSANECGSPFACGLCPPQEEEGYGEKEEKEKVKVEDVERRSNGRTNDGFEFRHSEMKMKWIGTRAGLQVTKVTE